MKKVWSKISFHRYRNKIIIQNFLINIFIINLTLLPCTFFLNLPLSFIFLSSYPAPCPGLTAVQVLGLFFNHYLHLFKSRSSYGRSLLCPETLNLCLTSSGGFTDKIQEDHFKTSTDLAKLTWFYCCIYLYRQKTIS